MSFKIFKIYTQNMIRLLKSDTLLQIKLPWSIQSSKNLLHLSSKTLKFAWILMIQQYYITLTGAFCIMSTFTLDALSKYCCIYFCTSCWTFTCNGVFYSVVLLFLPKSIILMLLPQLNKTQDVSYFTEKFILSMLALKFPHHTCVNCMLDQDWLPNELSQHYMTKSCL